MEPQAYQLKVQTGENAEEVYLIIKTETSIGRDERNDIVIHDATISRRHAVLSVQGIHYVLKDLNSTNGTCINDKQLTGSQVLNPGDVILFGDNVTMKFEGAAEDPYATLHGWRAAAAPAASSQPAQKVAAEAQSMGTMRMPKEQIEQAAKAAKAVGNGAESAASASMSSLNMPTGSEGGSYGANLTKQVETTLAFILDEDTDIWPAMLAAYVVSNGEKNEELKYALINDTSEWKAIYAEMKEKDLLNGLAIIARDKLIRWNIIIKNLLFDQGQTHLFRMYLQSLMAQKIKKIPSLGAKAQLRKQTNAILAVIAGNMLSNLDKYEEAHVCLTTGRAKDGSALSDTLKKFYEPSRTENLKQITLLLAVIIIFRAASSGDDIKKLQDFIRTNLIVPLKAEADSMPSGYDKTQANKRVEGYMQLLKTVDISFG